MTCFNSLALINKFFEDGICAIGTVWSNRKQMSKLKKDKKIASDESDSHYSKNIIFRKWYNNKPVLLLKSNVNVMRGVSNIMRQTKGSATKAPVSCPNIPKLCNNGMGGADIMNQKTAPYRLDPKAKYRFYLKMFFDLIDVALVNNHIVYTTFANDISLLNFKISVAKALSGRCSNRKISFPNSRSSKRKSHEPSMPREVPTHMREFQEKQMRCHYRKNEGSDHKTFVSCEACDLHLCLTKDRNCFLNHHL